MSAGDLYRAAFERLKNNKPERLPKGTPVSQNNVAKEAGSDPSALKKRAFPSSSPTSKNMWKRMLSNVHRLCAKSAY